MGIILLAVLMSVVTGHSSLDTLGHRIKQASVGRVLATIFHPDTSRKSTSQTGAERGTR